MTWEKTVMSGGKMWEHQTFGLRSGAITQLQVEEIAKYQAGITGDIAFKAGYKKRKSEETTVSLADMCMKHRKFGIETVVEWMIEPCHEHSSGGVMAKRECHICLQIALKEWGIDENN